MKLIDFEIGHIYTQKDLISAFGGSFNRVRGITPINSLNVVILTSFYTGRRGYEDTPFENGITLYTGEGQIGDQELTGRNKTIYTAKENGKKILLFVIGKPGQYKYYGEVELVGEPFYKDEKGFDGVMRKVIKFPLVQKTVIRPLTEYEMKSIFTGGITPFEKPIIQVVGAAIINDSGEVLCAQRGYGSLIGKWEFPGGKVEEGESDQVALAREIKEELNIDIEVRELIDENYNEYKDKNINLKVYKCRYISGEIKDIEHISVKWMKPSDMESLDWAEADRPIVDSYLDSLPRNIDGEPLQFDYFEAEAIKPSDKEIVRANQDYEKTQRAKQKSGENAEQAVIRYEIDKLNNLGHPELVGLVKQISKDNPAAGYDVLSYDVKSDGSFVEIHIEVKSARMVGKYVEFFISQNELDKFKKNPNHKIYCLIKTKNGRSYKLHEVNKDNFFKNNYLLSMTYRVRIRVAE